MFWCTRCRISSNHSSFNVEKIDSSISSNTRGNNYPIGKLSLVLIQNASEKKLLQWFISLYSIKQLVKTNARTNHSVNEWVLHKKELDQCYFMHSYRGDLDKSKLKQKQAETKTSENNKHSCFDLFIKLLFINTRPRITSNNYQWFLEALEIFTKAILTRVLILVPRSQ